jgi:hypothetical protein
MAILILSPKSWWHHDLVAHPATHAWVLNLYRAGERHPELVNDYFPARHAPWPWLARDLERHEADERRHVRMYSHAIEHMGEAVEDLRGTSVFNEVIRACTPVSFHVADDDTPDAVRLKLAHFCAHAHFLEARIARSLAYHYDACARVPERWRVAKVVARVLRDEERHTRYTREAVGELVDRRTARDVLDVHRRGERRANLLFSSTQVKTFFARFGARLPVHRHLAYRACAALMQEASAHV